MISPGLITIPAKDTGKFISPGPCLYGAVGVLPFADYGASLWVNVWVSRTHPSMMIPAIPLDFA